MEKNTFKWSRAIGIGVIVLLMVAGIYTAAQIGPYLPNAFNRLAAAAVSLSQTFIPSERLNVYTNPESIQSGDPVNFAWTHRNQKGDGIYSLSYACMEGVYVGIMTASGDKTLVCDELSDVYSENNIITIKVFSEEPGTVTVPLTLSYTKIEDANVSLTALTNLNVTGEGEVTDATEEDTEPIVDTTPGDLVTPPVSQTKPPSGNTNTENTLTAGDKTENIYVIGETAPTATAFGKADLSPTILEVGIIDKVTNEFISTTTLNAYDRIAVRFEVENLGTADSGHWMFSAVLPTIPMHIFQSDGQQPLAPGDKIEYTIGFDNTEPNKDGRFVVNVDPTGSLSEASEDNNLATTTIRASL